MLSYVDLYQVKIMDKKKLKHGQKVHRFSVVKPLNTIVDDIRTTS